MDPLKNGMLSQKEEISEGPVAGGRCYLKLSLLTVIQKNSYAMKFVRDKFKMCHQGRGGWIIEQ